ncbi:hypothetical protein AQZ49_20700 [Novosphingobium sp. FSW06-99]|nr:hypothetical protein AQZ49_20700 [Novosphingobium sp. FSW06-99]
MIAVASMIGVMCGLRRIDGHAADRILDGAIFSVDMLIVVALMLRVNVAGHTGLHANHDGV